MDLRPYIDNIQRQLAIAAEGGGDEARVVADRLIVPLDSIVRLTLQDVLALAAEEITLELAPGSVELRLRGRDPEFVVTAPPLDHLADDDANMAPQLAPREAARHEAAEPDDGGMSRINLRMPDQLKARVESAASRDGLSVNAWLVRAAASTLDRGDPDPGRQRRAPRGSQRYTGWVS